MSNEQIDLSSLDDAYTRASIDENGFDSVPDGKYRVNVEKVELTRAKRSGNHLLKWTLRIMRPQCADRLLWRNNLIATPENLKWLKSDLHICGLELEKLSDLPSRLDSLLDLKLEVTKRTKGQHTNVYFSKLIAGDDLDPKMKERCELQGKFDDVPF